MNLLFLWTLSTPLSFADPIDPWKVVSSITDQWKLAAFALAVVMFLVLKSRGKPVPPMAWVLILLLVIIPIGASVYQEVAKARDSSGAIYRVRVTVIDPQKTPVEGAKVWSSVGGEDHTVAGGAQFVIPAATVPQDGKVTIYAKQENAFLTGNTELQLGNDHNPAVTIQLVVIEVKVRGQVVDARGNAIAGALVSVVGYGNEAVTTQADGSFEFPAHAALNQQVSLHAEKPGYRAANQWHPAGDFPAKIILEK